MALVSSTLAFGTHLAAPRHSSLVNRKSIRPLPRAVAAAASASASAADEGVQLGTAKLPANIDEEVFVTSMFQWGRGALRFGRMGIALFFSLFFPFFRLLVTRVFVPYSYFTHHHAVTR